MLNNQSHSCGCWSSARVCFVTIPFHDLSKLDDKLSQTDECVTIGRCNISLAFCRYLQNALNGFVAAFDIAEMKISTSKTEVLHLLRNRVYCSLQVSSV